MAGSFSPFEAMLDSLPAKKNRRNRRPAVHPSTLARVRLAVYRRDLFTCTGCGWSPDVPDGYDGRYALGDMFMRNGRLVTRVLELDHVVPFIHGGLFVLENLQALCSPCNGRKGAKTL